MDLYIGMSIDICLDICIDVRIDIHIDMHYMHCMHGRQTTDRLCRQEKKRRPTEKETQAKYADRKKNIHAVSI